MEDQHIMRSLVPMLAVSRVSPYNFIGRKLSGGQLTHGADMIGVPTRAVHGMYLHTDPRDTLLT
jgi:hypothetical protein